MCSGHVVVICAGEIRATLLDTFLTELFHSNHGPIAFDADLLFETPPAQLTEAMLKERPYADKLNFFVGSALREQDLMRVRVDRAVAVFVLQTRYDLKQQQVQCTDRWDSSVLVCFFSFAFHSPISQVPNDGMAAIKVLSIKRMTPRVPCFMLVADKESSVAEPAEEIFLELSAMRFDPAVGGVHIFSVDDLKMNLLHLSCRVPGSFSLIANMIASFDNSSFPGLTGGDTIASHYLLGTTWEIYPVVFNCNGRQSFHDAVKAAKQKDLVLFAVASKHIENYFFVYLNPGKDYWLKPGDVCFVLAHSAYHAMELTRMSLVETHEVQEVPDEIEKTLGDLYTLPLAHLNPVVGTLAVI
jgi:hypothetical protein